MSRLNYVQQYHKLSYTCNLADESKGLQSFVASVIRSRLSGAANARGMYVVV